MINLFAVKCTQCGDTPPTRIPRERAQDFLQMHRTLHALGASRQTIAQAMFAHAEAIR